MTRTIDTHTHIRGGSTIALIQNEFQGLTLNFAPLRVR